MLTAASSVWCSQLCYLYDKLIPISLTLAVLMTADASKGQIQMQVAALAQIQIQVMGPVMKHAAAVQMQAETVQQGVVLPLRTLLPGVFPGVNQHLADYNHYPLWSSLLPCLWCQYQP